MKKILLATIASMGLLATAAHAQHYAQSPSSQLTINAGSGLMFKSTGVNAYNRSGNYRSDNYRTSYDRHDRNDRYDNNSWNYNNSLGLTAIMTTGNLNGYRNSLSRFDDRNDYRHDNGNHYGHDRREGDLLKDRYGNCYRIKEGRLNDTRIRVPSSRCRF